MKKARLWYVIADGGRARFVERDDQGAFRTLSSFVSTELHTTAHELGRDRPSRVKESASPARSAIEPRRDLHEAAKEDFIRTVAETLAADLKDEKFDELVLVAPPGVIAELKGSLSKPTAKVVVKELHKDLTKVPDHELTGHLTQYRYAILSRSSLSRTLRKARSSGSASISKPSSRHIFSMRSLAASTSPCRSRKPSLSA